MNTVYKHAVNELSHWLLLAKLGMCQVCLLGSTRDVSGHDIHAHIPTVDNENHVNV